MLRKAFVLILTLACTACLRSTTTIDLRADGSGTVVQETAMSSQALAMLKGFAGQQGDTKVSTDPFGEEQARKTAATMGVTFVSGEPFKTADFEGYRARYSFDDISKVKINMEEGMSKVAQSTAEGKPPFGFALTKGSSSSVLTIQMPEQAPGGIPGIPGAGAGATDAEKAQATQALGMMKMMMKGLFVDVALNVDGRIIKSNAPHVEGSRVTLLQIDFDKMLADGAALEKLMAATDLKTIASVPGLKVAAEPKLTIEFGR